MVRRVRNLNTSFRCNSRRSHVLNLLLTNMSDVFHCLSLFLAIYKYRAGVLVPKSLDITSLTDLRGKRSCHTGVWRTAGWSVPVGHLLANGIMVPDCRGELDTVSNFFDAGSCAPGRWSSDPLVDAQLSKFARHVCDTNRKTWPTTSSAFDKYDLRLVLRCRFCSKTN